MASCICNYNDIAILVFIDSLCDVSVDVLLLAYCAVTFNVILAVMII